MPAKRFRCYRCLPPQGREFDADAPECPACKAGPPAVVKLTLVHFLFEHPQGAVVGWLGRRFHLACQPGQPLRNYPHRPMPASGDPLAVSCPACRQTAEHKKALEGCEAFDPLLPQE